MEVIAVIVVIVLVVSLFGSEKDKTKAKERETLRQRQVAQRILEAQRRASKPIKNDEEEHTDWY